MTKTCIHVLSSFLSDWIPTPPNLIYVFDTSMKQCISVPLLERYCHSAIQFPLLLDFTVTLTKKYRTPIWVWGLVVWSEQIPELYNILVCPWQHVSSYWEARIHFQFIVSNLSGSSKFQEVSIWKLMFLEMIFVGVAVIKCGCGC